MARKKQAPRKSPAAKGVRTALQSLVALLIVSLASEDFQDVLFQYYPELTGIIPVIAGTLAFLQNKIGA